MLARTYSPTTAGAMTSSLHWSTTVGTVTSPRSARLSERKVTRAKCRPIAGSVAQNRPVSSSPTSGRSGLPAMTGAVAADQPR